MEKIINKYNEIMDIKVSRKKFIKIFGSILLIFFLFPKNVLADIIGNRYNSSGSESYYDTIYKKYVWKIDGVEMATLEVA